MALPSCVASTLPMRSPWSAPTMGAISSRMGFCLVVGVGYFFWGLTTDSVSRAPKIHRYMVGSWLMVGLMDGLTDVGGRMVVRDTGI